MQWLRRLVRSSWTLPLLFLAFSQWEVWISGPTHLVGPRWATGVTLGAASLMLAARRRAPLLTQVAVAITISVPWVVWGSSQVGSSFLVGVTSTYAVGRWGRRPIAYLGIAVAAAWALLQIVRDPLQAGASAGWGWVLYAVVAWAAGAWVRQVGEAQRRRDAERANLSRAELAEQRLGIARDLHDALANSLAVMVVHAEAAEEVLTADPGQAAKALQRVQVTGREALREVRSLLAPLRDTGGAVPTTFVSDPARDHAAASAPRPGMAEVDALVDRMRAAGLPVDVNRQERRSVPPEVGEVIYRVLQESLSNTVRHAGLVPTHVHLDVDVDAITLDIEDQGNVGGQSAAEGGNGLPGMGVRVRSLGGELGASSQPDGGFAVHVTVPLDGAGADTSADGVTETRAVSPRRRRPASTDRPG